MPKQRRDRDSGSIFQRKSGRWVVQVAIGVKPDGKTRYQQKSPKHNTKTAANALLKIMEATTAPLRSSLPSETGSLTVGQWLERYIVGRKGQVQRATQYHLEYVLAKVIPKLGAIKLHELRPRQIHAMMLSLASDGASADMQNRCKMTLSGALEEAVRLEYITRNPAKSVRLMRRPVDAEAKLKVWTPMQCAKLLDAARRSDTYYPFFYLALVTGMRRGELLALRWKAIDWQASGLRVQANVSWVQNVASDNSFTKTAAGARFIALSSDAMTELHRQRARLEHSKDDDLVLPSEAGNFLMPANLYIAMRRYTKAADLPSISIHGLRHSHASHLIALGKSIPDIAKRLGHKNPAITMKVYAHFLEGRERETAVDDATLFNLPTQPAATLPN